MDETAQYCGCHPGTKREIKENGMEGITISGVYCPHRRLVEGMGWQSFCTRFIRLSNGCEK